jgi:acyl carrier protein
MKEKIRKFLQETLLRNGDTAGFSDDDSLVKSQRLDSLDVMDLLLFIEEHYAIPTHALGEDVTVIDSLNLIIHYVGRNLD